MIEGNMTKRGVVSFLCLLLTRQLNTASRHPLLSEIGRLNTSKPKKDSGQAGMTRLSYLLAGLLLVFSLAGCSKAPSDTVIKSSIKDLLMQQLPLSWGGSLLGSRNTNIELIEIKEKGKFHDKEKYLLIKARVKGSCESNIIFKWELHHFDNIGEFRIHQDDYGKWLAETVTADVSS